MEMRFHIPTSEVGGDMDAVEAFHQQVMNKASVISVSGDAIAIFRELQCLTPRYVGAYIFFIEVRTARIVDWYMLLRQILCARRIACPIPA